MSDQTAANVLYAHRERRWAIDGARLARVLGALVLGGVLASAGTGVGNAASRLQGAQSWAYQLQGSVSSVASSSADVAVIDPDHMRGAASRLKAKPGGGRRTVLAYLSIGEAESWRRYYKRCCTGSRPSWLTGRTQGWGGNYVVNFWEPGWKAIVKERVREIMAAGFDGLYLDRIDTWENVKAPGGSRAAMIAFVREVSAYARSLNGNAAIMVQNGEELLDNSAYLAAIDGIAKEDLLHGIHHNGARNSASDVRWSAGKLKAAQAHGKRVFVIEYLGRGAAEDARAEIRRLGFVPLIGRRDLAGGG